MQSKLPVAATKTVLSRDLHGSKSKTRTMTRNSDNLAKDYLANQNRKHLKLQIDVQLTWGEALPQKVAIKLPI